jgi:hypothetical protein
MEGITPGVTDLSVWHAHDLLSLAGIEACTSMEKLSLDYCGVSSLQALRALSNMKELRVHECSLTSLVGINCISMHSLRVHNCSSLIQLSGVEHLASLKSFAMRKCLSVTSLQPLSWLGQGLQLLTVYGCKGVQDEVLELPHVQARGSVIAVWESNVKEVVLADGVKRSVG